MPASNIFGKRADYISGKEKSLQWAKTGPNFSVHRGESFNIDMGTFGNRMWYAYHHKKSEIPKLTAGLDDWLDTTARHTHDGECASRFIYGDWNSENLKGAYGWCLVTDQPSIAERLRLHLRNYHSILALALGWQKRPGSKDGKPVLPTVVCGNRTFVVDDHKTNGYFDSKGRYREADNLDNSSLDYQLAHEMGIAAPVGIYEDQVRAFQKVAGRSWRSLTVEETGDLARKDTSAIKRIVTYLAQGPFFSSPVEILMTTEAVVFCLNKTKGGSTCAMQAMMWAENPDSIDGPWKRITWWDVDPRFGWLTTDPPMRQKGRQATTSILKQNPTTWTIEAVSEDNDHFDVAHKKYLSGSAFAQVKGELVYHLKWSEGHTTVEFPSGVWSPGQGGGGTEPDNPSGSCIDWLKKLIGR